MLFRLPGLQTISRPIGHSKSNFSIDRGRKRKATQYGLKTVWFLTRELENRVYMTDHSLLHEFLMKKKKKPDVIRRLNKM